VNRENGGESRRYRTASHKRQQTSYVFPYIKFVFACVLTLFLPFPPIRPLWDFEFIIFSTSSLLFRQMTGIC